MNKKFLSAILFSAMMVGTGTFTSCIDNDEPAGITELRGAKAELLRAKAAVETAKVALVQAEAAAAQAQATLLQAQAAAVQAESAETIKKIQAETEAAIAQAESIRQQAELDYQNAIIALKQLQASLAQTQVRAISEFVAAYDRAYEAYQDAVEDQVDAQRAVNKQLAVKEENEAKKDLITREAAREVYYAEKDLEAQKATLAEAQAELAEAETLEPHELEVKLAELQERQKSIRLAIADLSVEAAEAIQQLYDGGRVQEIKDLKQAYFDLMDEERVIPEVTFDYGDGAGYPLYVRGVETLDSIVTTVAQQGDFNDRHRELQKKVDEFTRWTRDENDNAWTKQSIIKMTAQLDELKETIAEVKKSWAEAVAAYNTDTYNVSDPTKISGYDELAVALKAYNDAAAAYNVEAAAKKLVDTEWEDHQAMWNDIYAAEEVKNTKSYEAYVAWYKEEAGIPAVYDAELKKLEDAKNAAEEAETAAKKAFEESTSTDVAILEKLKEAWEKAIETSDEADLAYEEYALNGKIELEEANWKKRTEAEQAAEEKYLEAKEAAEKIYNDKWADAILGTGWEALNAANAKVNAAYEVVMAAYEALIEPAQTYNGNIAEVYDPVDLLGGYILRYNSEKGYDEVVSINIALNKEDLIWAVQNRSSLLFGTSYGENVYGDKYACLVEMTAEEIEALIAEKAEFIKNYYDYENECYNYGLMGQAMYLEEKIRIAQTWLDNKELIDGKIEQAEEALAAIELMQEEIEEAKAEKWDAYTEAKELIQEEAEATLEPINAKRLELEPLKALYDAYVHAIEDYKGQGEDVWSAESIEDYINTCKTLITEYENAVYAAETDLMYAQDALDKWNSGDITRLELLQIELEKATAAVERATAALQTAETRLQKAIAALEWTAAE